MAAIAAAGVTEVVAVSAVWGAPVPDPGRLLGVAALLAVGEASLARARFGRHGESYSAGEIALVVALASVPAGWVPLLALATIVAQLVGRRPLVKAAFNVATAITGSGIAAVVAATVGPAYRPTGAVRADVALALGAAAYVLWTSTAVVGVIAASTGRRFGRLYRTGIGTRAVMAAVNVAVGLWAVHELRDAPFMLLAVVPPFAVLAVVAYRGYARALDERDLWQGVEAATKALNRLDVDTVVTEAARGALRLFRVDAADVVVRGHRRDDERTWHREMAPGVALRLPTPQQADDEGGVGRHGAATRVHLADRDVTLVRAALPAVAGMSGSVRLWSAGRRTLSPRSVRALGTYAQAVSAALTNARLHHDVTELAERKSYEAEHDALTGLANRALLFRLADESMAQTRGHGRLCALVLLDLDHFKVINDTLGHVAGDGLLRAVAGRLLPAVRTGDTVSRLGGDEFAVLLHDLDSPATAIRLARALLRLVAEPMAVGGLELSVQASAGVAVHPGDARDVAELLQHADAALYHAKRTRGSVYRYDEAVAASTGLDRLALGAELRGALERRELRVAYQAQVDLQTRHVVGFEALVRWAHPSRGLIPPNEFIPVAEQSELITEITVQVLDHAVGEAVRWAEVTGLTPAVGVNVSARSALDLRLRDEIAAVLSRYRLDPRRLTIEITETGVLAELDTVADALSRLRDLGVRLSVDDFGTGFASLTFLQRVPLDEIKVDRSFVGGMLTSPRHAALVKATVDLARSFGLVTVAEGVESEQQADLLAGMGVGVGQGYWFSKPVWKEQVPSLIGTKLPRPGDTAVVS